MAWWWPFGKNESRSSNPNREGFDLDSGDAWRAWLGGGLESEAGEDVGKSRALTLSPVWQAVKMISGDCAKLPLNVFRRLPAGGREVDWSHYAARLLENKTRVNEEITGNKFWRRFFACALLWENSYAWIERQGDRPVALYNLLPDRTAPYRAKSGQLYFATEIAGELQLLHADDVLHLEGLNIGEPAAVDLVEKARHDFGLALAARKFSSKFFANGAHAGGILQIPPGATKAARDKVENTVEKQSTGTEHSFKTLILRDGFKWFSTTVDPDKAKLIELDEQQIRHVARWFNLRPSRLGVKESVSYNSEEAAKQDYYDSTLSYWLIANVAEVNAKLLSRREQDGRETMIDYNVNALLWADAQARSAIANAGIQSGRFTIDETRAWENLNPLPNGRGAVAFRPLNVSTDQTPAVDDKTPPADPPAAE